MNRIWVRREFADHGLTQFPPGPHLPPRTPGDAASPSSGLGGLPPGADRLSQYQAGSELARAGLSRDRPDLAAALARTAASDVLVMPGLFDHVEQVLDRLRIPYRLTDGLPRLEPRHVLLVNCGAERQVDRHGAVRIRRFVRDGGTLFSTDWALTLTQKAFPGMIAHNGRSTANAVVGVRPRLRSHPLLRGAFEPHEEARWWLESASFPVLVIAKGKVQVLLKSTELMLRWNAAPVVVYFRYGRGEVVHSVSHFYLQQTDARGSCSEESATDYAIRKGGLFQGGELDGISGPELASATSSARLLANLIAEKRRRVEQEAP